MDMYFGSGIDDLIVPNRSDRLPSPDSWSKWGVGAPESYPIDNNGIMYDPMFADEEPNFKREGFFGEAEMEDFVHDRYQSSSSSVNGGLSEDSFRRSMLSGQRPDYQLDELASPGQMDDIFLSSLLEDLPGVNNVDKSICYSPKSQGGLMQSDHFSRDTKFSVENVSSGMQNKGYLTTHAFSPSYALGNDDARASAKQKDYMAAKPTSTEISNHSEQSCMDSLIDDDTPLEESVLQEFKMVMNQFTEKTRICFRDSLYRLANNSKQHDMTPDQDEDLCVEVPHSWSHNAETMRSGTKRLKETETNFVDRAIANLMFNKRDFHTEDLPVAPSSSNSNRQVLHEDAEAPFFDGKDVSLTSNSSSGNKSSVEDFGSMAE